MEEQQLTIPSAMEAHQQLPEQEQEPEQELLEQGAAEGEAASRKKWPGRKGRA